MRLDYFIDGITEDGGLKTVDLRVSSSKVCFISDNTYYTQIQGAGFSEIGTEAFKNHASVQKFILPLSLTDIGESAFEGCKDLQIVEYTEVSQEEGNSSQNSMYIRKNAFKDCNGLHTVIFPYINEGASLTIAKDSFAGCSSLRTIVLRGNGKFHIHPDAFCHAREVTLVVTEASDAEAFAVENGYRSVRGN